jgi:hypothetical protein
MFIGLVPRQAYISSTILDSKPYPLRYVVIATKGREIKRIIEWREDGS